MAALGKTIGVRLPAALDAHWRDAFGHASTEMARWAIAAFLLDEGLANAAELDVLPWRVLLVDGSTDYRLAATAEEAVNLVESEGIAVSGVLPGWENKQQPHITDDKVQRTTLFI